MVKVSDICTSSISDINVNANHSLLVLKDQIQLPEQGCPQHWRWSSHL